MPGRVERPADRRQRQHHPGQGFVMHGAHRLDGVPGVSRKVLAKIGHIGTAPPIGLHKPHLQPVAARHRGPLVGEIA